MAKHYTEVRTVNYRDRGAHRDRGADGDGRAHADRGADSDR